MSDSQQYYEHLADSFAGSRKNLKWPELELLKKYMTEDTKLLDLGCGSGRLLDHITISKQNYVGVDYAQSLVEVAKEQHPDFVFIKEDMTTYSDSTKYNIICCVASLHHIMDVKKQQLFIHKLYEMLDVNGILFLTNWNLDSMLAKPKNLVITKSENNTVWEIPTSHGYSRFYYGFSKQQITRMLESADFEVLFAQYMHDGKKVTVEDGNNIVHIAKK